LARAAAKRRMGMETSPNEIMPFQTDEAIAILLVGRLRGWPEGAIRRKP
jgi:hypothetical protein